MSRKKPTDINKALPGVLTTLVKSFDDELYAKTPEQLEEHWHFVFDESATVERNIYEFYEMLDLYGGFCRRWEEHHNGWCCVVDRVHDQYLMPKIRQLAADLRRVLADVKCEGGAE